MNLEEINFHSDYLKDYMAMVEETESPRLFHLWGALSALAGTIGREAWLPLGVIGKVYPNLYVLLVGNPAVRKSTALKVVTNTMKNTVQVRYAPTDTGGQRQGILKIMAKAAVAKDVGDRLDSALDCTAFGTLMSVDLGAVDKDSELALVPMENKPVLYAAWSELTGAIGQASSQMLDFLVQAYDVGDYVYETRTSSLQLTDIMMNMIAATTPSSIASSLPANAVGQGFMSRLLLVYGENNYKSIPRPKFPDAAIVSRVKDTLVGVQVEIRGAFNESTEAGKVYETLYEYVPTINDPRFQYYGARRATHLVKLGMLLAASRLSMTIEAEDYRLAHILLKVTEEGMSDALGQFGLSPIARLKQDMLDYLKNHGHAVNTDIIKAAFHRDARPKDIMEAIDDLATAKMIVSTQSSDGTIYITAVREEAKRKDADSSLIKFLTANGNGQEK